MDVEKIPDCMVCHDLSWDCFPCSSGDGYYERVIHADYCDLLISKKNGCRACSLIQSAVSEFSKPLLEKDLDLLEVLELSAVEITLQDGYSVTAQVWEPEPSVNSLFKLEICSEADTSNTYYQGYPMKNFPSQLDMDTCMKFLQKQISSCDMSHRDCIKLGTRRFPSRLLHVVSITPSISIKLVETHGCRDKYIALSHRWGNDTNGTTTTTDNYSNRVSGIPWLELPKTYQDAVLISYELGVKYLWIDSLCIIQDDGNDWEIESAKMADVYSHAYLTIAATGSSTSSGVCLFAHWHETEGEDIVPHSTSEFHSQSINMPPGVRVRYAANSHQQFEGNITVPMGTAPLLTRAWVFQERFLSTRTIHFHGEEMIWECQQNLSCECGYFQWREAKGATKDNGMFMMKTSFTKFLKGQGVKQDILDSWLMMVEKFTALGITHASDRLPAMAGLKERIMGRLEGPYLMGIWGEDIVRGLLWRKQHHQKSRRTIPFPGTDIPTWSWASVHLLKEGLGIDFKNIWKSNFMQSSNCHVLFNQPSVGSKLCESTTLPRLQIQGSFVYCTMKHDHGRHETAPSHMICSEGDEEPLWLDVTCDTSIPGQPNNTWVCCVLFGSQDKGRKRIGIALVLKPLDSGLFERIGISEHRLELGWFDKNESVAKMEVV